MRRDPEELDGLVAVTSELTGRPARLVDELSFSSRAVVARLALGDGETVIAKKPLDPSAFTNELEALRVLPSDSRPELIGSANGVLVMEDLGRGPSLADLLLADERVPAERALHAWAEALGRALGATLRTGRPTAPPDLGAGVAELVTVAGELGVPVPPGVEDDVRSIATTLSADSPWLAYCPGDTCPDNNRVLEDGSVRLFDFEGSGWRHAATEAAHCRAPFCTCWCVAALPVGVTDSMEAAFLHTLDPPGLDTFRTTIDLAAIWWTLLTFDGPYLRRFVHDDVPIGPPELTPLRGRQFVALRLRAVESQRERLPALGAFAGNVREAILLRWPDAAELPTYPAFR